jgi:hypothetical protein
VVLLAGVYAGCIFLPSSHDGKVSALGWAAFALNTLMYASPIAGMRAALAHMDRAAIPVLLTVSGLGCSGLWGSYGLLKDNIFLSVPNAIGVLLSVLQLAVAAYIYCGTSPVPSASLQDGDDYGKLRGDGEDGDDGALSFADDASTVNGSVSGTLDRGLLR